MKLQSVKNEALKQYNLGPWLGGLKDLAQRTVFYVALLNFVLISITAYNTTLKAYILPHIPWFSFPIFIALLLLLVAVAMVLEYKFILPSTLSYLNRQFYIHQNPIRSDLDKILKKLEKLEAERSSK